jgi:hypothetical protein
LKTTQLKRPWQALLRWTEVQLGHGFYSSWASVQEQAYYTSPLGQPFLLEMARFDYQVPVPSDFHMFPEWGAWDRESFGTVLRRA